MTCSGVWVARKATGRSRSTPAFAVAARHDRAQASLLAVPSPTLAPSSIADTLPCVSPVLSATSV